MPLSDEEIGLSGRGSTSKLLSDADIGLEPNDYIQSLRKQVASSPDLGFVSGYKRELGDLWNTINMHLMGSDQTPTNMAPAAANWLLKQATTPANYMLGVGLKNVVSPIAKRVVAGALAAQGIKGLNEVLGANTPPQQGPIAPMFGMTGTPIGSWAGGTPIGIPGAEGAVAQLLGPQTIPEYPQPFPPKENVGTKGQQTEELLDALASGGMALGGHMAAVRLPRELYNENAEPFFGGRKPTRVLSDSDIGLLPAPSDIQPTALLPRFAESGQTGMTQPSSGQQITMMPPNRFAVDAKGQVVDLGQLSPNELVELMRGPKVYKAPEARVPAEPPELSPSEKKAVEVQSPQPRVGPGGGRYKPFRYEPDLPARSTYFSGMPLETFYEKERELRGPSGTPKTTISAREFPLNKTAEAKRPFSLFGRDKLSSRLYSGTPIEPLEHEDFPIPLGRLRPVINLGNQLLIGERGESHDQILERNKPILEKYGLTPSDIPHHDEARGFTIEGNTHPAGFLSRKAASYITGVSGTAKAGGLDSQDIPPKFSQQSTKGQANAVRELRTDSISQAQPPGNIQPLEEEIRRGAGEQGAAREGEKGKEEGKSQRRANVGRGIDDRQTSYLYSGLPLDHSTFTKSAKDLLSSAIAGHWNRERMAQLLDAADNMAKTPEQKKENRRIWLEQLNQIKMPDGKPLVAKRGKAKEAPEGFEGRNYQGAHVWVNKEVADLFDTLTGESFVRKRALGRVALRVEEELKHKLLAFDSYHAFRIARKTFFQTGKLPSADHLSLLENTPEEVQAQFDRNEISKEALDFHKENYKDVQFLLKNGLNVKLWDENPDVRRLFENEVKIGGIDINPLSYGQKFNSWVFNKLSRSAMLQVGLYELKRARNAHPKWTQEQLGSHVAKQTNIYMGNLGRQGFFKSQGMKDLMQVVFLAPSWVEALAQSEGRAAKQFAQIPVDLARGKGLNMGTQAKGIGAGIAAYVVANQIINMATKGHPTWENDEPGRKFDAYIPDFTGKGPGFWLSPFSDMAETTHDYLRYAHKGYGPIESTGKIIENKLSPIGRAEEALRVGRDYAGRKLDEGERVGTAVKSLIPTPLPLAGELSETPGSEQRQVYSSFGLKVEPAGRHEGIGNKTLQQRVEQVRKEKSQQKISSAGKVTATEESVYHDQERAKEVTSSLSRADRNWMESRGMSVPGFANNVRVGGVNVPFSEEETKRMTEMVKEETKRIITTLRNDSKFTEISQARQQEVFNTRVRIAARTARDRVVQDMGKGQGSHAQNLGKTKGGFRILQPQTP